MHRIHALTFRLAGPACALGFAAPTALAHDGHGMGATHWHATDAWGFLFVGAVVAVAFYWRGRK